MKKITLILLCHFITTSVCALAGDTIHVADFGARPYSYENYVEKTQAAIIFVDCGYNGGLGNAIVLGRN